MEEIDEYKYKRKVNLKSIWVESARKARDDMETQTLGICQRYAKIHPLVLLSEWILSNFPKGTFLCSFSYSIKCKSNILAFC